MSKPICYYLNPEATGGPTLHKKGCVILEQGEPRIFLGSIYALHQAITLAKRHCSTICICRYCLGNRSMNREVG